MGSRWANLSKLKLIFEKDHFSPIRSEFTEPKGVLSKLDGRLLSLAPAGSPEWAAGSPATVDRFPVKVAKEVPLP